MSSDEMLATAKQKPDVDAMKRKIYEGLLDLEDIPLVKM